jgi:addiction module HigA family antidote
MPRNTDSVAEADNACHPGKGIAVGREVLPKDGKPENLYDGKVRPLKPFRRQAEGNMARTPIHPGEILGDELEEIGISAKRLADVLEVPPNRLYQILAGKRSMTADTALRLARYFGMSATFWMNLQSAYELDLAREQLGKAIQRIPQRGDPVARSRPVA